MASRPPLQPSTRSSGWMPASRARILKAARFNNLRNIILSASGANLNEDLLSGTQLKDKLPRQLNTDAILAVSEGICISIASVSCLASLTMHGSQDSRLVSSSLLEPIMPRKADLPLWQTFFLLAALVINSVLRARQWQRNDHSRNSTSKQVVADSNVEGRVQKLEEDIASAVSIIRVLSKQLEKLAVRFRVTRQTLRDPIQKTAGLAQRTSETVNILAAREDSLEKNLEEMHHVLLRMQENQTKQLELISTLGKLVKEKPRNKVEKISKAGLSKLLGVGLQQGGQERVAKDSNGNLQHKVTGIRSGSAERSSLETKRSDTSLAQSRRQTNTQSSPSVPNSLDRDSHRVDFWLSSPVSSSTQMEESVSDTNVKSHALNDGKPRAAFLD
ncbi:hypothetical protein GOP47_0013870 [Adiantum capillus-veneris]|uniref:Uncharacterized protein n=1 Tax=Adiantum capillus-veneris TaxID=13818 RepID=A0A9D4ZDT1_ADICA|nr:hypothetical protein GOP47_0013870 [Adiantum capillus-veneris]